MQISDRNIVLNLNANWQAINIRTVKEAFISMNGGDENNPPVKALDISYVQKEDGTYDFETQPYIQPVSWTEWCELPIREYDLVINTSKQKIRVPTVIVSVNYNKIPKKRFRPTKQVIYDLQRGRCGYTNEPISFKQGNIEHVQPRSQGGRDTFENLLVVKKEINSKRGNKPLEEMGLKRQFHHKEPAPIPVTYSIKNFANIDWQWFIK